MKTDMDNVMQFLKRWMLVTGMLAGAGLYIFYRAVPALHPAGGFLLGICRTLQPMLLFAMLFLSFCKISPSEIRPRKWMGSLLLVQGGLFIGIAALLKWVCPENLTLEAAMLCLICPTATAAAVVTGKLGGQMAGVVTYTVLINLLVSILFPLLIPFIHPVEGITFMAAFFRILAKVFPLLIMPCLSAWLVRWLLPRLGEWFVRHAHWSFYLWAVALTMAILMSARAIWHSEAGWAALTGMAVASMAACIFQFWAGRRIGRPYDASITAGQSLGQKNTVFAIWLAYTFMNPVVSVAGGFYSIWHNCWNTWQLRKKALNKA